MHWLTKLSQSYSMPYHENGVNHVCQVHPDGTVDGWPETHNQKTAVVDDFWRQLSHDPLDSYLPWECDERPRRVSLSDDEFAAALGVEYERLEYQWRAEDDAAELREEKITLLRELSELQRWLPLEGLAMLANARSNVTALDSAAAERMIVATKATVNGY